MATARKPKAPPAPAQFPDVELVAIDSVKPDPHNARERTPRNLDTIRSLLAEFGQQKPIVVDHEGVILAGNGTWQAAKALGWTQIAVSRSQLTGSRARAYALGDNRSSDLSQFDERALVLTIGELGDDLARVAGFDAAEIEHLIPAVLTPEEDKPDTDGRKKMQASMDSRISVRVLFALSSVARLEHALQLTGVLNREKALGAIVDSYLEQHGEV